MKRRAIGAIACALLLTSAVAGAAGDAAEAEKLREQARVALERNDYREAASLLERAFEADGSQTGLLKDLAVALASDGRIDDSVERYRQYLERVPDDEAARLAMATTLSWSKDPKNLRRSEELLTEYLAKRPGADEALLQRARVRSWTGQSEAAEQDFRAFLAKHPDDTKVKLELAMALSGRKDAAALAAAIAIYDAHLATSPSDLDIVLQRGRVHSWANHTAEAARDYRAYLAAKPDDDAARLELARLLSWDKASLTESLAMYDAHLAKHPEDAAARMGRARALLWGGYYGKAERELDALRKDAQQGPQRNELDLELARLYGQTGRGYDALDLLDEVLARDPQNAPALAERARLQMYLGSRIEPRFFYYEDKSRIRMSSILVEGRAAVTRNFALLADVSGYTVGNAAETLLASRVNAGVWGRIRSLELEATLGPRFYELFGPNFGARAAARLKPAGWTSLMLDYHYDDIYYDMLQPASISAGIRGHALHLTGEATLPYRVRVSGRVGTRVLEPDNRSLDSTLTIQVSVVGPLSVGYNVQYITWRFNDPSYWSPQAFAAHLGVVRVAQTFARSALGYDVQGVAGVAGERIVGVPEAGFGFSFGLGGAATYTPTPRVVLRLGGQYSQTIRELPVPVVGGSSTTNVAPPAKREPAIYWWLMGTASATFYF
jgi:Tfp pilus assembly protein PilF